MFVERLHPRDHDGKFARGADGALHVVSTSRGGPVAAERGTVRAAPPAAARGGDGVWSGAGLRHVGVIGGREYHLKRAGGVWSVYDGPPESGRRIGTAATIADAKAHAHAHAGGGTPPPAPAPARRVPAPDRKEKVTASSRAARVSPTTAAKIRAAREAMPTDLDGWHEAARDKPDKAEIDRRRKAYEKAQKVHDRERAKLDKIRADYTAATGAAMRHERDAGLHTRYDANGREVPITDEEIDQRVKASALNQPAFRAQQKKAIASLVKVGEAMGAHNDAAEGLGLPRDANGLPTPSPQLNAHLDAALEVGRAVLADAKAEMQRTAPPHIRKAREAVAQYDAWAAKLAVTDEARSSLLHHPDQPVSVTLPNGAQSIMKTPNDARALEGEIRRQLYARRDATKAGRQTIAAHEQKVLRDMLDGQRPMGGIHHSNATAEVDRAVGSQPNRPGRPRADWRERLTAAEEMFPRAWLLVHAGRPLSVGASDRAYYSPHANHVSFSAPDNDHADYDGAFKDLTGEVAVHELGHRMEQYIPGLTALEFAMVRRRATGPDGTAQPIAPLPGYGKDEKGQPDEWGRPYAGKTYEGPFAGGRGPHETPWEVFQVGLQDTFGRGRNPYGRKSDPEELQAFVLGAMLTLGR